MEIYVMNVVLMMYLLYHLHLIFLHHPAHSYQMSAILRVDYLHVRYIVMFFVIYLKNRDVIAKDVVLLVDC